MRQQQQRARIEMNHICTHLADSGRRGEEWQFSVQFAALTSNDSRNAFPNIIHSEVLKTSTMGGDILSMPVHSIPHSLSQWDIREVNLIITKAEKCLHPPLSTAMQIRPFIQPGHIWRRTSPLSSRLSSPWAAPRPRRGPSINDVSQNFGIFDPLPPVGAHQPSLSWLIIC